MRVAVLTVAVAVAAAAVVGSAAPAPPRSGIVVAGKSLGGVRLGMTDAEVVSAWGSSFGICRNCADKTWYYTFAPFQPQGVGVTFRGARVVALFTLWSPPGWHTTKGLTTGDDVSFLDALYGPLTRRDCDGYYTLRLRSKGAVTEFYVKDDQVWGFGLSRALTRCR